MTYAYHTDALGSVVAITSPSGAVVATYAYDPYGAVTQVGESDAALAARNPLRYRAYYHDTATGLYYLPARYYDPDTMRFLSPDPAPPSAGDPLTLNRYAYCVGDPVDFSDPTGEIADIWREHPGGVTVGMKVMTSVAAAKRSGATGWDASYTKHSHQVAARVLTAPGSVRPSYRMSDTGWVKPAGYDSWQIEWLRARGQWDKVDDYERDGVFEVARTSATVGGIAIGVLGLTVAAAPLSIPLGVAIALAAATPYIALGVADIARAQKGYCTVAQPALDFTMAAMPFAGIGMTGAGGAGDTDEPRFCHVQRGYGCRTCLSTLDTDQADSFKQEPRECHRFRRNLVPGRPGGARRCGGWASGAHLHDSRRGRTDSLPTNWTGRVRADDLVDLHGSDLRHHHSSPTCGSVDHPPCQSKHWSGGRIRRGEQPIYAFRGR